MPSGKELAIVVIGVPVVVAAVVITISSIAGYHFGKRAQFNNDVHAIVESACKELNGKIVTEFDKDCNNVYCVYDSYKNNNTFNLSRVCEETVRKLKP